MHDSLGLSHWHPFMDITAFRNLMNEKDLYGIYQHDIVIATFNLSIKPRDYYVDTLWSNSGEKAVYLGQLATDPTIQGRGIGKWCMNQIITIAKEMGCEAIRFDALNAHPWLKLFYEKLGYHPCGLVKPKEWELMCFEKILD